jgi:hypothetical protein
VLSFRGPRECSVSVYPTLSPSCDTGADRKIRPLMALFAAACAVPIDLRNCRGTAISPYSLAVLLSSQNRSSATIVTRDHRSLCDLIWNEQAAPQIFRGLNSPFHISPLPVSQLRLLRCSLLKSESHSTIAMNRLG